MIIKIKNKFKPNIAIDMVAAALAHYRMYDRPVKIITLNESLFIKWKQGMIERDESLVIEDEMQFKNCTVKKGSKFMEKGMEVELKKLFAQ